MIRGLAAAAAFACVVLGLAVPAHADQLLQGVYNYTSPGAASGTYQIWPSCVPVVGDLREPLNLPVACRLHMVASAGLTPGDARLVDGIWQMTTPMPQGMTCPDGTTADTTETVKFDDTTMTGTRSILHGEVCGLQPGMISVPFTLSYQGPLPRPNEKYPLYCEPAGLRICQ